ncbi:MAG: hypothetical protein GY934_23185 [Gammaproteobacteria bacterium]|nr:hypothetical protein [Gammaproteobacteria bacterium]
MGRDSGSENSDVEALMSSLDSEVENPNLPEKRRPPDFASVTRPKQRDISERPLVSQESEKCPNPSKFAGMHGKWGAWANSFKRWAHTQGLSAVQKVSQISAWVTDQAEVAYQQFLHGTHGHSTPSFTAHHNELVELCNEYSSPTTEAQMELTTLHWDLYKNSPEQFVSKLRHSCHTVYSSMSEEHQNREAGICLMTLLPMDIGTLVRRGAGITNDIVKLSPELYNVLNY